MLVVRLLERLQGQPHIDALFHFERAAFLQRQVVRGHAHAAEHFVESPFASQRLGIGMVSRSATLKEMRIHNFTHAQFLLRQALDAGNLLLHKRMQSIEIQNAMAVVHALIIIAHLEYITTVIKYTDFSNTMIHKK